MLFNSLEFIIFFPLVTVSYFLVPHAYRWIHLLLASCIFYAAFIPSYLLILILLILIDYSAGILIENSFAKKKWLVLSILANLGLLGLFKYYNFFITNINELTGSQLILLYWALPIGLSFHTFQSLSYTIEVYRGRQKAVRHLGYYALYVMFYPQLVAGPIERPGHLIPQLFKRHPFSSQNLYEGLRLMAWGFFKKTVIADRVGEYADAVFTNPAAMNGGNIWLAVFFFSIQIYADFSGYSDIATGSARCMGFDLVINFNRPYQAISIRDFWRRWHISLSSWFRDYVYIPLGGNRKGLFRKNINLLFTFIISGFWHGAGWTFVCWGFLHGIYVLIYDGLSKIRARIRVPTVIAWLLTGLCVGFAWIFFRAPGMTEAFVMIERSTDLTAVNFENLVTVKTPSIQYGRISLLFIAASLLYMFLIEKYTNPILTNLNRKNFTDITVFVSTLLLVIFFGVFHRTSFIYFQF
jgi:D-alanyl-lipoteichoic acid acyltransferase DltB (MBOAT superfamily)